MRVRYVTADVFTDVPFGGNPLAVFPDATGLRVVIQAHAGKPVFARLSVAKLPESP